MKRNKEKKKIKLIIKYINDEFINHVYFISTWNVII